MRSFLALCIAVALSSGVSADCDACLDGQCYRTHLLPGARGRRADIDRNTNTLYVVDVERRRTKQCNLDTATCSDTALQLNISTIAVDQRTGDIYGSVYPGIGIYKLDLVNNKTFLLSRDEDIWHMTFKDKLYYCRVKAYGIFTLERGGNSRLIAGTEHLQPFHLFVDKIGDIYYNDLQSIHVLRSPNNELDQTNSWNMFSVAVDKNGDAIFINSYTNAVYRVTNREMVDVGATAPYILRPLFDRDNNLIYTTIDDEHYHLKRVSKVQCTVTIDRYGVKIVTETERANATVNIEYSTESVLRTVDVMNGASAKPSVLSVPITFIFIYLSYLLSKHPWTSFSC